MHDVSHAARPRHHPVPEKTWFACIKNGLLKVYDNVMLTNKNKFRLTNIRKLLIYSSSKIKITYIIFYQMPQCHNDRAREN